MGKKKYKPRTYRRRHKYKGRHAQLKRLLELTHMFDQGLVIESTNDMRLLSSRFGVHIKTIRRDLKVLKDINYITWE